MPHMAPRMQDARQFVRRIVDVAPRSDPFVAIQKLLMWCPVWQVLLSQHGVAKMHVASSFICWMTIAEMSKSVGK